MAIRISIVKDGVEFFLKMIPGQRILLEDFVGAFDNTKSIKSGYNIGLKFPVEGNEFAFDFANSTATRNGYQYYDANIYGSGIQIRGTLILEKTTSSDSAVFDTNLIGINYATLIEGKTIRDVCDKQLDFGSAPATIASAADDANAGAWPDFVCAFPPIKNDKFYDGPSGDSVNPAQDYCGVMNAFDQDTGHLLFSTTDVDNSDGSHHFKYNLVPQVYVIEVMRRCFEQFGYRILGTALDDSFFCRQLMLGLRSLDRITTNSSGQLSTVANQVFDNAGELILWENEDYTYNMPAYFNGFNSIPSYRPVPSLPIDTVVLIELRFGKVEGLVQLLDQTGALIWELYASNNQVMRKALVLPQSTVDFGIQIKAEVNCKIELKKGSCMRVVATGQPGIGWYNYMDGRVNLSECVPEWSIKDFLLWAENTFMLDIDIDDMARTATFRLCEQILSYRDEVDLKEVSMVEKQDYEPRRISVKWRNDSYTPDSFYKYRGNYNVRPDIASFFDDDFVFVYNENAYLKRTDGAWEMLGHRFETTYIEAPNYKAEDTITLDAELVTMENFSLISQSLLAPSVSLSGESGYKYFFGAVEWPMMIMTYYGMAQGSLDTYPFASCNNIDYNGDMIEDKALLLDYSEKSIFKAYMYHWLQGLTNPMKITLNVISGMGAVRDQLKYKRLRLNDNLYMLSKASGDIDSANTLIEMEMQTVKWHTDLTVVENRVHLVFNTVISADNAAKFSVNGIARQVDFGDGTAVTDIDCLAGDGLGVSHEYSGGTGMKDVWFIPGEGVNLFDVSYVILPLNGDGPALRSISNIPTSLSFLYLQYNNFITDTVNSLLIELDANGGAYGEVYIDSQNGGSAPPSGDGITAKANLIGKGWVVVTD